MHTTTTKRPLVPSSSSDVGYGGGSLRGTGGAKNHWVMAGHLTGNRTGHQINIGSWNVRTMQGDGKLENLQEEMKRNQINILGLSEARWKGNGDFISNGYRIIYSGGRKHTNGVAVVLDKHQATKVKKVIQRNDRIILVKIDAEPKDIIIIQVYMPTSQHSDQEIEEIYESIEELLKDENADDYLVIMGDWNAVVGEGKEEKICGEFGLGRRNTRGDQLIDFCKQQQLVITNTWYQQEKRRRYTWKAPGDTARYQIDYIMVRQRYRNSIRKACSYPGADINSDHNLVLIKTSLKLKKIKTKRKRKQWNLEQLKRSTAREEFRAELDANIIESGGNTNNGWNNLKKSIKRSALKTIGYDKTVKAKKPWITQEMIKKMEERRKWKSINTQDGHKKYRQINNELRRETETAREKWWRDTCEAIEELQRKGRTDKFYAKIKQVTSDNKTPPNAGINNYRGELLTKEEDIRNRWREYIEELYNKEHKPTEEALKIEDEGKVDMDDKGPDLLDSEILEAIREMKHRKAQGSDEIPAEFLKAMGPKATKQLIELCKNIYKTGDWPKDFCETTLIPIPKKNNATDCKDFRTISLISHASKIVLRILTKRLEGKANGYISNTQFGFRKGVGTREAIAALRLICERKIDLNQDIHICFIDFEKAFDKVNWRLLLDTLQYIGIDWRERRMIRNLYLNQEAVVRINNKNSKPATIGQGVRQGCLLSPLLFLIYIQRMMNEAMEDNTDGINIGGNIISDIRFADDQAMIADTEEGLQRIIDKLDTTAERYNMKINIAKTKIMCISKTGDKHTSIQIKGHQLEQVDRFKYLGAIITSNARCTNEIRCRIGMAKTAFLRKRELLTNGLTLATKKKIIKAIIWSVALYAAETWTIGVKDTKALEAFEMWIWRIVQKISWKDKLTNEEVLSRIHERRSIMNIIIKRKKNWIGHIIRGNELLQNVIEGQIEGKRERGRPRNGMLDKVIGNSYANMKKNTGNRVQWRRWM